MIRFEGELIICDKQDTRDGMHNGQNMDWNVDYYELEQGDGEKYWLWQCEGCEQALIWAV